MTKTFATGRISQIIGPVVDISFENEDDGELLSLPGIHDAIKVTKDNGHVVILEVHQHTGERSVRTVAMDSTDGLRRGAEAFPTGSPIRIPVGPQVKGRLLNVTGQPIDGMSALSMTDAYPIHREPPKFEELITSRVLYRIKVIDLLEPYSRGGKIDSSEGQALGNCYNYGADK